MTTRYALMILRTAFAILSACEELPDPDGMPAAQDNPVTVFILLRGQSSSVRCGAVGLAWVVWACESE